MNQFLFRIILVECYQVKIFKGNENFALILLLKIFLKTIGSMNLILMETWKIFII